MVEHSTHRDASTGLERLSAFLDRLAGELVKARHDIKYGNFTLLGMDLRAVALFADDALGECDALCGLGEPAAYRVFVERKARAERDGG